MDWIKKITGDNFLGIYDVVLDIYKETEIAPDKIIIPLFPSMIKFQALCPMEGVNHRDNYCSIRWKAVEFLKSKDIIEEFELLKGSHRWDSEIRIKTNKAKFQIVHKKMNKEYNKRLEKSDDTKIIRGLWDMLHPVIVKVSKKLFKDKHYPQCVFEAMKEVNNTVKQIVKDKTGKEYDGANLMCKAFSPDKPIIELDNLSTRTGKNIQEGYMQIFAGSMKGVRNPKAHDNVIIDRNRAIHFLYLSSLLMFKIDEAVEKPK